MKENADKKFCKITKNVFWFYV